MPVETVKKSQGIQVWGALTASGLSDLHIMPQSFHLKSHSYVSEILERKLVQRRSDVIFQHEGAPAHTAANTELKLQKPKIFSFGIRGFSQATDQISTKLKIFGQ
ncbi:unnamed protein product [Lepeophtheirus salmonis]|uniref:(salmon louse) hypothetical protein n=1 Tax=Lepeophtheirus salmonis TaxID=72036 RepID=A0A7R8CBD4_LEPSM|nr:unnamed protein product [Lepeophtheirus salmonis]CAF2758157.1 unnamed protein product [Lepeophtheirus salmonis]